jgi:hypothetical protein
MGKLHAGGYRIALLNANGTRIDWLAGDETHWVHTDDNQ